MVRCNDVKLIHSINKSTYKQLYVDYTDNQQYKNDLIEKLYKLFESLGVDYSKEKALVTGYITKSILNDALQLVNNQGTQEFLNNQILFELANPIILQQAFEAYIQSQETKSGELIPTSSFTKEKEDIENNFSPSIYESLQLTSEGVEEYKDIDIKELDNVFSDTFFSKDNDIYTNLRNIFKGDLFGTLIFNSADTAIPFKDISNVDTVTDIINNFKNQLVPTDSKQLELFNDLVEMLKDKRKFKKAVLAKLNPDSKELYSKALAYVHFDNMVKVFLKDILGKDKAGKYSVRFASNLYNQMIRNDEKIQKIEFLQEKVALLETIIADLRQTVKILQKFI